MQDIRRPKATPMTPGQLAFYVLAAAAIVSAIGVVGFRNAVYSALSLIANLFCLALFYLMLNAMFISVIQVLIYAGAIMVLFLFVVTMLSSESAQLTTRNRLRWQAIPALGLGFVLIATLGYLLIGLPTTPSPAAAASGGTLTDAGVNANTETFGLALFRGFLFPFEVTSVLLVAAILGAVVLGRRTLARGED
jgi:NADH-quinone oxidoreductase subunit J